MCAKNHLMTLGPDSLWIHNTSFYLNERYNESIMVSGDAKKRCLLESHRVQNGGALVIVGSENDIEFYEVVMPYKTTPPFDFGNIRLIM